MPLLVPYRHIQINTLSLCVDYHPSIDKTSGLSLVFVLAYRLCLPPILILDFDLIFGSCLAGNSASEMVEWQQTEELMRKQSK